MNIARLDRQLTSAPTTSTSSVENTSVIVAVEDIGTDIAPDKIDGILDALATIKSGGMGLGLPICKSIVESDGGRISAMSDPGRGSVFWTVLPRAGFQ